MPSLYMILTSLWMEFWEHKTESLCFLSLTEGTDIVVNSIDDDVWEAEDEQRGAKNYEVESWDEPCLYIFPMSLTMKDSG